MSTAVQHDGHLSGTPQYRRVLVALFAAGIATFALLYSPQALLPALAADLHVSSTASTLTLSLTTLGLGLALLVAGPVSDVVGRTRLVHLSLTASAVLTIACALAPSWHVLLGLRLLDGIALAGLPAVATAYLREELHASTHARAAGLYVGGTAFGGMLGRLLTGAVGEVAGWRWAFAAIGLLGLVCAAVVLVLLPASQRFVAASPGVRTSLQMTRRALSDPALLALYGIGACAMGALVGALNTTGFRLEAAPYGLGLGAASLVFLVYPLGSLSSTGAGRLADVLGRRAVAPIGAVVAVAGILLTLLTALPAVVVGLALLTIGFFAVHGISSGWVPVRAHAGGISAAQAASLYLFAYYLGSSVFGSVAARAWTAAAWPGVVALTTALLLVTGGLTLALRRMPSLL